MSISYKLTSNFTNSGLLIIDDKSKRLYPQDKIRCPLGRLMIRSSGMTLKGNSITFCVISKFWIIFLNIEYEQRGATSFPLPYSIFSFDLPGTQIPFYQTSIPLIGDTLCLENKIEVLPQEGNRKEAWDLPGTKVEG